MEEENHSVNPEILSAILRNELYYRVQYERDCVPDMNRLEKMLEKEGRY